MGSSYVRCDLAGGQDKHTRAEIAAWSARAALAQVPDSADRTSDPARHHRRFFRDPTTSVEALAKQIRRLDAGKVVIIGGDPLKAQALRDKLAVGGMVLNLAAQ